ncbi:MAG: Ig-like domain-containing protein [Oscillospiraceae bacterium]|nr:Ig-like domain-containing protein [Oscillospiraceae bacterium]
MKAINKSRAITLFTLAMAALTVLTAVLAVNIAGTLTVPEDIHVVLESESGISPLFTVEVGESVSRTIANLNQARNSDPGIADLDYTAEGADNLQVTGLKAGLATISYGTKIGLVSAGKYQVTDSRNISAYIIKDGGEVRLESAGETKPVPVEIAEGSDNIKWRSANTAVATVNQSTGRVTAVSKGAAVVIGEFTDKWGAARSIFISVGVGIDGNLSGNGNIIKGGDGGHYRPVGVPPNVYEVVEENGSPKQPPEYVYNPDGNPGNGNNRPAVTNAGGGYLAEDPSNIWKEVLPDGSLKQSPALWGGANGKPGGGDDKEVVKYGDDYWVDMGQNVWRMVDKSAPRGELSILIGGGPGYNPAGYPATQIFDNTARDGKYYVGPFDSNTEEYFFGDPPGGNGLLESTDHGTAFDDVKYYRDAEGNMITIKPEPPPDLSGSGIPGLNTISTGGIIEIDGIEWIKVRSGIEGKMGAKWTLLLKKDVLPDPTVYTKWKPDFDSGYNHTDISGVVNGWYYQNDMPVLKSNALHPHVYGHDSQSITTGHNALTGAADTVAFVPSVKDVYQNGFENYLGIDQLLIPGKRWWTSTHDGRHLKVLNANGSWGICEFDLKDEIYVRPAIFVRTP